MNCMGRQREEAEGGERGGGGGKRGRRKGLREDDKIDDVGAERTVAASCYRVKWRQGLRRSNMLFHRDRDRPGVGQGRDVPLRSHC